MENLPKTFLFPQLNEIVRDFKGVHDHVHPLKDQARLETLKWFSSFEKMDAQRLEILKHTRTDYLMASMYPNVDFDGLVLSMQWIYWSFLFDDTVDSGKLTDGEVKHLVQMYEDVQRNRTLEGSQPRSLIIEAFQGIWRRFRDRKCPQFEGLFAEAMIDWTTSLPQVNDIRKNTKVADMDIYKASRRRTLGLEAAFYFGGLIRRLSIDEQVIRSAEMKQLDSHIIEMSGLINDIFSWNVEQSSGDMCNFISVLIIREKRTVQEAMDEAEQQLRSQAAKLRLAKLHVLNIFAEHKDIEDLKSLIETNVRWLWIAVEWSFVAADRYFGGRKAAEEARDCGIVQIMPLRQEGTQPVKDLDKYVG
ncbi:isoprenoid synthase domain-containing protein [Mycena albidolilacea]|uniref:Terpene synthase n=1 Tax=Mycena albidolilacea TaxID=1033008 RepID=A0AAD7ED91_9AGAR|nr:isoprenoid synthase domain-containing protein [Mycena albidolilacea]